MSSTLENFIREHRNELDVYTPSAAVWSGIEAGIHQPTFIQSKVSWLKYTGFSASVIAALVYLKITTSDSGTMETRPAELKAPTSAVTAAISAEAPAEIKANVILPAPETQPAEVNQQSSAATSPAPVQEPKNVVTTATTVSAEAVVAPAVSQTAVAPDPPYASSGIWMASKDTLKIDTVFSGVKKIEVESSNFDINITSVAGDRVSFKTGSKSQSHGIMMGKHKRNIKYGVKDEVLKITEEKESGNFGVTGCETETAVMNFEVPVSTDAVIHSSSGDVSVKGLQGKVCNITIKSGDVKLENLNTELILATTSGDLSATSITGKVSAKVTSGDVSFSDLKGNMDLNITSGDQQYKNITGNIKVESTSGDLKIIGMHGNATVISNSGDIILEDYKGSPTLKTNSGDIQGKNVELTEGMDARTHNGDIRMKLMNSFSSLSFDLDTNYGSINIDKDGQTLEEDKKLVLKNGNILIKAHTSSGDQSYR